LRGVFTLFDSAHWKTSKLRTYRQIMVRIQKRKRMKSVQSAKIRFGIEFHATECFLTYKMELSESGLRRARLTHCRDLGDIRFVGSGKAFD
jgi:hypothetical protein